MLARTYSATIHGSETIKVEVEVETIQGIPSLTIIGLASRTLDEAKERITAALMHCGVRIRSRKTIVNLAPAEIKKNSSVLELAMVVALLKNYQEIKADLSESIFLGELSLDGQIKAVKGLLPLVLAAQQWGFKKVFFPQVNQEEVAVIKGIKLYPVKHLRQLLAHFQKKQLLIAQKAQVFKAESSINYPIDFADIHGQLEAKRCLEIAAAGGHNLLMIGPPGAGKSLLAQALISILPPLTQEEALEVTKIYSICGLTHQGLISQAPFRSPHHSISQAALIGGSHLLKPGEISLAHHGVLFLDEFPEFNRQALESLRQPMQTGMINITRVHAQAAYSAAFTLIAAANPCPCGYYLSEKKACQCHESLRFNYLKRLSGPILDRIEMHLKVKELAAQSFESQNNKGAEKSSKIKERVIKARQKQYQRWKNANFKINAKISNQQLNRHCQLSTEAKNLLLRAVDKYVISARSYFNLIKVAQTIADLRNSSQIELTDMAEALGYRNNLF